MRKFLAMLLLCAVVLPGAATRAAGPEVLVPVRHVYDGCGTLCYLGALAMATRNDSLPYLTVMRYTNPALVENGEQVLGPALSNLGYTIQVSGADAARVQEFVKRMQPSATTGAVVANREAALQKLKSFLAEGKAPMIPVAQAPLWDDRVAAFRRAGVAVPPNPGAGPHYLVVTGYDDAHFYVNDTAWPGSVGLNLPLRKETFLKAWDPGSLMMTVQKVKDPVAEAEVLKQVLRTAHASVDRLAALQARLAKASGNLDQSDFLDLSAGAYRRQVLADWLAEAGHKDAAQVYRSAVRLYERVRPTLTNQEASRLVGQIHRIEQQAAALLPK